MSIVSENGTRKVGGFDRTPLGRSLLNLRAGVYEWIDFNRGRVPQAQIDNAYRLACELGDAAWNGLAANKAALIEGADRMLLRRYSGNVR